MACFYQNKLTMTDQSTSDIDRIECWRCGLKAPPESVNHYGEMIAVCGSCGAELLDVDGTEHDRKWAKKAVEQVYDHLQEQSIGTEGDR